MNDLKDFLEEFIDWARDCGEDAFYIFEETDEAINKFLEQRKIDIEHGLFGELQLLCDCDKLHDRMEESNNRCITCNRPII